jgi:hypothetical protein
MVGNGRRSLIIRYFDLTPAERDKHTRRAKDDGQASETVGSFRGVTFSSWLRIFMQVSFRSLFHLTL